MFPVKALAPELVVAQMLSAAVAVLQSPSGPVAVPNLSSELTPPTHLYAVMLLTPPPFENSETTRTSLSVWVRSHVLCPLGGEQLASPCRNQKPTSLVPLSLFFSSAKYMILWLSLALVYAAE